MRFIRHYTNDDVDQYVSAIRTQTALRPYKSLVILIKFKLKSKIKFIENELKGNELMKNKIKK